MKFFLATLLLVGSLHLSATGKKHRSRNFLERDLENYMSDGLLNVEPLPPQFQTGQCTCECCTPEPEPLNIKCENDVVIGVDSSACFRDYHSRMNRFMKKLVRRIGRTDRIQYGGTKTRLALMQFSSDILYPLQLNDFNDYTNPPTSRAITTEITREINNLRFLGEGSFLNKALNSSVIQFESHPRPYVGSPHKVLILLTNGNSHPDVTLNDIENSIRGLKQEGVSVIPVAVTRECYGNSETWSDGLCPNTVVLKKLAKLGSPQESFLEMSSQDTISEITNYLQACAPANLREPKCNNCTCSCELPIGPQGPPGPRGPKGDFVEGEPGEKGGIGPKGEVGPKGFVGPKGEKGFIGDKGEDGRPGEPGFRGPKGSKGEYGDKGIIGPKGIKGEVGPKGGKGFDGDEGPKGRRGDKGNDGDKGEIGYKGNVGDKGDRGPPGPRGPKGLGEKGMTGPPGNFGDKGNPGTKGGPGDKGMPGPSGLCGKPGPAGLPGQKGVAGNDGADGEPGPQGTQGPRGENGRRGDKGNTGEPGVSGLPGSVGLPGERGPRGPQGPFGNKGEKGEPSNVPGSPGLPGVPGPKGFDGSDGRPGNDGRDGPAGQQGPRGYPGLRGPSGEIDLNRLRPMLVELIREMIPGDCGNKETPCREYPIDLAFLVDGSDSIDREDFDRTKEWILQTVDAFKSSIPNIPLYVAVVQFSERSQIEIDTLVSTGSQEIRTAVIDIEQMRSGTKTYSALQFVDENVYPLMRSDSFKILITMTDGDASESRNIGAIDEAHEQFDRMVAVGVGPKTDREELLDFSSNDRVFSVENFEALEGIISEIVSDTCSGLDQALESTTSPGGNTVPTPTDPGCYNAVSDVAFVIDGSASVGQSGFALLRNFLHTIVSEFQNVGENGIKVALIQYSDEPRLELAFRQSTDKNVVLNSIHNMEYLSGNTRTGFALEFLKDLIDEEGRSNAKKVTIVITDGRSQDDVLAPAESLKNAGALMFAIGVGEAEEVELIEIASSPAVNYVYNVVDYVAISSIKDSLVQNVCRQSEGTYKGNENENTDDNEVIFPEGEQPTEPSAGPDFIGSGDDEYNF